MEKKADKTTVNLQVLSPRTERLLYQLLQLAVQDFEKSRSNSTPELPQGPKDPQEDPEVIETKIKIARIHAQRSLIMAERDLSQTENEEDDPDD
jgi:hypothetical protein